MKEGGCLKKLGKIFLGLLVILGLISVGSYYYLKENTYEPSQTALTTSKKAIDNKEYLFFKSPKKKLAQQHPIIIFYPGALVEPESYSVWANKLSETGYDVAIVKMPLNLAILDKNRAEKVIEDFPDRTFVFGGHSLGGVMSSRYVSQNVTDKNKGIFFLASYPDKKGALSQSKIPVLSITASKDQVLNHEAYEEAKQYLPAQTKYVVINGGNHSGFGAYGEQKKDGEAEITNEDQQIALVNTIENWLKQNGW